jgi:hypothetical protein
MCVASQGHRDSAYPASAIAPVGLRKVAMKVASSVLIPATREGAPAVDPPVNAKSAGGRRHGHCDFPKSQWGAKPAQTPCGGPRLRRRDVQDFAAVADVVRAWSLILPAGSIVMVPPQGASAPGP